MTELQRLAFILCVMTKSAHFQHATPILVHTPTLAPGGLKPGDHCFIVKGGQVVETWTVISSCREDDRDPSAASGISKPTDEMSAHIGG